MIEIAKFIFLVCESASLVNVCYLVHMTIKIENSSIISKKFLCSPGAQPPRNSLSAFSPYGFAFSRISNRTVYNLFSIISLS